MCKTRMVRYECCSLDSIGDRSSNENSRDWSITDNKNNSESKICTGHSSLVNPPTRAIVYGVVQRYAEMASKVQLTMIN